VTRTIQPALAAGAWVLSDRFFDSTEAYQVYGQGGDPASYAALKTLISPHPDLTLMLVVSPEVAAAREAARGRAADRYDRMGEEFRRRVTEGFLAIAAANPARCVVVNGDGGAEDVAARIFDVVAARFL
jgi:dTMP kinase